MRDVTQRFESSLTGIIITTSVLLLLLVFTGFERSINIISNADLVLVLVALVLANSGILITATIWKEVLAALDLEISFKECVKLVFSNTLINNLTPFGHLGGEPFVVYKVSKDTGKDVESVLSAIIVSDVINFSYVFVSSIMGLIGSISFGNLYLLSLPVGLPLEKIRGFIEDVFSSIKSLDISKRRIFGLLLFSQLTILTDTIGFYLVILSLGVETAIVPLMFLLPLARIANYVPTPGGAGSYEVALSGLLIIFLGLGGYEAATATVVYRSITYYFGILAGALSITTLDIA